MGTSAPKGIRVLLADDHHVLLEALSAALEGAGCRVVAQAKSGVEAVRLASTHRFDVAVVDVSMPVMDGFMTAREILHRVPQAGVVLLTALEEADVAEDARTIGVRAVVNKSRSLVEVVRAIEVVAAGGEYGLPPAPRGRPPRPLTEREREVLRLIGGGRSTKEVAALLGVSFKTAESHRSRLMKKLDIHETAGLVRYALRRGLIRPDGLR